MPATLQLTHTHHTHTPPPWAPAPVWPLIAPTQVPVIVRLLKCHRMFWVFQSFPVGQGFSDDSVACVCFGSARILLECVCSWSWPGALAEWQHFGVCVSVCVATSWKSIQDGDCNGMQCYCCYCCYCCCYRK